MKDQYPLRTEDTAELRALLAAFTVALDSSCLPLPVMATRHLLTYCISGKISPAMRACLQHQLAESEAGRPRRSGPVMDDTPVMGSGTVTCSY